MLTPYSDDGPQEGRKDVSDYLDLIDVGMVTFTIAFFCVRSEDNSIGANKSSGNGHSFPPKSRLGVEVIDSVGLEKQERPEG